MQHYLGCGIPQTPKSPKAPLFKKDMIRPAAQAAEGAEEEEGKGKAWLRNLVCGFEVEVPVERIQQETVGEISSSWQKSVVGAAAEV